MREGCRDPTEVMVKVLTAKRRAICPPSTLATPVLPMEVASIACQAGGICHHASCPAAPSIRAAWANVCATSKAARRSDRLDTTNFGIARFSIGEDARKLLRL